MRHISFPRQLCALGAAGMLVLAGCGGGGSPDAAATTPGTTAGGGELGPAEQSHLTVAVPFPDFTVEAPFLVGMGQGYYKDEGLTLEIITANNVNAAVASGSADLGLVATGEAINAIGRDLDVAILSSGMCRETFDFVVQPGIDDVQELDGKKVVLAGTPGDPTRFERKMVLAQEGWDLDKVDVQLVYPGPDSASWREYFIAGRVALIPYYDEDEPALEEYGANFIVSALRPWPSNVLIARPQWVEDNPNTTVRFLRAMMKSVQYIIAPDFGEPPAHMDEILDTYKEHGFEVAGLRKQESNPWVLSSQFFCSNLYFGKESWNTTIQNNNLDPISFEENVDLSLLKRAQDLLGLDNSPPVSIPYP